MPDGEERESYKEFLHQLDTQINEDMDFYQEEAREKGETFILPGRGGSSAGRGGIGVGTEHARRTAHARGCRRWTIARRAPS